MRSPQATDGTVGPEMKSIDLLTNTIFSGKSDGQVTDLLSPPGSTLWLAGYGVTASSGSNVVADGVFARITFNTKDLFSGSWDFRLFDVGSDTGIGRDTNMVDIGLQPVLDRSVGFKLTIIPEPSSLLLALSGIGLAGAVYAVPSCSSFAIPVKLPGSDRTARRNADNDCRAAIDSIRAGQRLRHRNAYRVDGQWKKPRAPPCATGSARLARRWRRPTTASWPSARTPARATSGTSGRRCRARRRGRHSKPIWDKLTGEIDRDVALYWRTISTYPYPPARLEDAGSQARGQDPHLRRGHGQLLPEQRRVPGRSLPREH